MPTTTMEPELNIPPVFKEIPTVNLILTAFGAVGFVCVFLAFVHVIMVCIYRSYRMVSNSFPSMDDTMSFGCVWLVIGVLLFGAHLGFASKDNMDLVCQSRSVVLLVGMTFTYGSLFMKTCLIFSVYSNNKKKKVVNEWVACFGVFVFVCIDVAMLISQRIINPITLQPDTMRIYTYAWEGFQCIGENWEYWTIGYVVFKGFLIVFGALMCIPAIQAAGGKINDLWFTAIATFTNAGLFLLGVILMYSKPQHPRVSYLINGSIILFSVLQTLIWMIIAKVQAERIARKEPRTSEKDGFDNTGYRSSGTYQNATPPPNDPSYD